MLKRYFTNRLFHGYSSKTGKAGILASKLFLLLSDCYKIDQNPDLNLELSYMLLADAYKEFRKVLMHHSIPSERKIQSTY